MERATTYWGFDPSMEHLGVAWWDGEYHMDVLPGIEYLGGFQPLLDCAARGGRCVAAVERAVVYVPGYGRRFAAHQAASSRVEAFLRAQFPRRNTIQRVTPSVWRKAVIGESLPYRGKGEGDTKEQASAYCLTVLRLPIPEHIPENRRHNAFEATCILEYARTHLKKR